MSLIENMRKNITEGTISSFGYENFKNQLAECFAIGMIEGYSKILSPGNMNKTIEEMNGKTFILDNDIIVFPKFKGDTLFHIDMLYCKNSEDKIKFFNETPISKKAFFNYIQPAPNDPNSFMNYSNMFDIGEFTRFHKYMRNKLEQSIEINIANNILNYNKNIIEKSLEDNKDLYETNDYMRYLIADAIIKSDGRCSDPVIDLIIDVQEAVVRGQHNILKECCQKIKDNFEPKLDIKLLNGNVLYYNDKNLNIIRGRYKESVTVEIESLNLISNFFNTISKPVNDKDIFNYSLLTSIVEINVNKALQENPVNSFKM